MRRIITGRPAPSVTWRRRAKVIDDSYLTLNDFLALEQSGQLLAKRLGGGGQHNHEQSGKRSSSSYSSDWSAKSTPESSSSSSRSLFDLFPAERSTQIRQQHLNSGSPRRELNGKALNSDDNNQANLINADPSLALLESLWFDWRSWPEYEYFSGKQLTAGLEADSKPAPVAGDDADRSNNETGPTISELTNAPMQAAERRKQVALGAGQWQNGSEQNAGPMDAQPNQPQLLSMEVHESITTAVNVLKLASLAALTGPPDLMQQQPANETGDRLDGQRKQPAGWQPQIECQASNLHYDLRTLIKLFAPRSLVASGRDRPSAAGQVSWPLRSDAEETEFRLSRQLVEASHRAFESLLSAGDWPAWRATPELWEASGGSELLAAATALRQIKTDPNSTAAANQPGSAAAAVIYQQLSRPHQLASAAAGQPAEVGGELPPSGEPANNSSAPSSLLVRKLINLDVYGKPRSRRINKFTWPIAHANLCHQSISPAPNVIIQCSQRMSRSPPCSAPSRRASRPSSCAARAAPGRQPN